jgi:hypothetical protein
MAWCVSCWCWLALCTCCTQRRKRPTAQSTCLHGPANKSTRYRQRSIFNHLSHLWCTGRSQHRQFERLLSLTTWSLTSVHPAPFPVLSFLRPAGQQTQITQANYKASTLSTGNQTNNQTNIHNKTAKIGRWQAWSKQHMKNWTVGKKPQ